MSITTTITEIGTAQSFVVSTTGQLRGPPGPPGQPGIEGPPGPAGTVPNLAQVATTGLYDDLDGKPAIPSTPSDIGAATAAQGAKADGALQASAVGSTVAPLVGGLVPSVNLPSYVDDVIEVATFANLPATGESGKIYVTDTPYTSGGVTSSQFRWSGTAYVPIIASPGSTDAVTEGSTNRYFTAARVLATVLSGLSLVTGGAITSADTVLVAVGKLQKQITDAATALALSLAAKLDIAAAFTSTITTGTTASATVDLSVNQAANSTAVPIAHRISVNYSSTSNMQVGGYIMAGEDVVNTVAGSGTHDKLIGRLMQFNLAGGNCNAPLGFEAEIASIGATTQVAQFAGFIFPNHRNVANINNVTLMAAFTNQDRIARVISAGPFCNDDLLEISPPRSAGAVVGRYYSAPAKSLNQMTVTANILYVTYVFIPRRCTIASLGFNVQTGVTGQAYLGLYKVKDNIPQARVAATASLSTGTAGNVEGTVSVEINSGTYAIVGVFSAAANIVCHEIADNDIIGMQSMTSYSEAVYTNYTFAALPATLASATLLYAANTIEPHLCLKIAA